MDISFGEIGLSDTFFNPESGKAMLPRRRTRARLLVLAVFKKKTFFPLARHVSPICHRKRETGYRHVDEGGKFVATNVYSGQLFVGER